MLTQCFMFVSRLDDAQALADALVKAQPGSVEIRGLAGSVAPLLYQAEIAAVRGDTAKAMHLIESLPHGIHPYDFIQFHIEPAFRSLYAMPRFRRFLVPKG